MLGKIAIAATAAFSVTKLVQFGKQAVDTASDLAEVQNVVDTAFGQSKQKMEDFADTAVEAYGISKLTAKQTGSTFMAMAAGMGLANDNASDMAVSLTGLSADMASFYNVEQDVASTALKSIFTGETETLKQFGIVMTDANLSAFALSQGISKSTSEMTQAEKVQLRYAYVMKTTALAQGDFAKTSDGWANQTRILSEKWKEFSATIGTVLMNVLLPAIKLINSALSGLITYAQSAASALSELFGLSDKTSGSTEQLADSAGTAADDYSDMAESAEDTEQANENQLASFDKINKLGDDSESKKTSSALSGLAGIGSGSIPAQTVKVTADTSELTKKIKGAFNSIKKVFSKFKSWISSNFGGIFGGIWNDLKEELGDLKSTFGKVFSDMKTLASPLMTYINTSLVPMWQTAFTTMGGIVTGTFDTVNTVFSDMWNIAIFPLLTNLLTVFLPLLASLNQQIWQTIGTLFTNIKTIIDTLWTECISPIIALVVQVWCDLWTVISEWWNSWGVPIFDAIREAITNIKDTFLNIWENFIRPVFDTVIEVVTDVWENHIKPLISELLDFIGELITGALDFYNNFISPIVNWLVEKLGPVFSTVFSAIARFVGNTFGNIIDAVKGVIETFKGIIQFLKGVFTGNWKEAWEGIKNIFKGVWDAFVGIVKTPVNLIIGIINKLTSAVEKAINWIIDGINSLSFDVPDWVPVIGGETFGFDISPIDIPEIPKLATGAVIPPNSEFLALLGDQKHGTNVEAPLDTITQAVMQALVAYGGAGGNQKISVTIPVELKGRTISQVVIDDINDFIKRNGKSPIKA